MKYDYCIGNPPYQDESFGENKEYAPPVYNLFLDAAYSVADKVEMIHPARFLSNAGSTPKAWNQKMLDDPHLKITYFEQDSSKVFSNTDIKGGVVISYHDKDKDFGAIKTFTPYPLLNRILNKVTYGRVDFESITSIIYLQNKFVLDALYEDHPEYEGIIGSEGKDKRFRNNIFEKIDAFTTEQTVESDIEVIGVINNKRVWRYIQEKYVDDIETNLYNWKAILPRANGKGDFGETISTPLVLKPRQGYTQTFVGIGSFLEEKQAIAALKYVKTKFSRSMLSVLKITQMNNKDTWKYVPLQDFTSDSDIDWSVSVAEIDRQLYKKYGLDADEIAFIEENVKEMK